MGIAFAPVVKGQQTDVIQNPRTPNQPKVVTSWIKATQVAEFGGDDAPTEALFGFPAGLVALPDGQTYILDGQAGRILLFDGSGSFIKSFASAGDGPGELNQARGMYSDGTQFLFVQNKNMMRIERFTLGGAFVDSHAMLDLGARQLQMMGAWTDGTLVLADQIRGQYALKIRLIDTSEEWKVKTEFDYLVWSSDKPAESVAIPPEITIDLDRLIIAHPFEYQYRFYDLKGNVLGEMHREFEGLIPPYAGTIRDMPMARFFSNLINPFKLNDTYWIGRASWPTNLGDPKQYFKLLAAGTAPKLINDLSLDVFDNDFNLVLTLNRDEYRNLFPGRGIVGSDGQGHIFVASETGSVIKYRVDITK